MTKEKREILDKVNELLDKKTEELLKEFPYVHEIDDGIIIRFFTEWDNCADDDEIRHKKIVNFDDPDESVVFFYIPKDAYFDLKQRYYIGCIACLNGNIDIISNGITRNMKSYSKMCFHSADVQGKAFENTYLLVTSNRKNWDVAVLEAVKKYQ